MTKPDNILLIDDGKLNDGSLRINQLKYLEQKYPDLLTLSSTIDDFFDFGDIAGNDCKLKFSPDAYRYIFIHHSYDEPTLLPTNGLLLIKNKFKGGKVYGFSGGSTERNEVLHRNDMYGLFPTFIEYFIRYKRWMPYCFEKADYKRRFALGLLEELVSEVINGVKEPLNSETHHTLRNYLSEEFGYLEDTPHEDIHGIKAFFEKHIERL